MILKTKDYKIFKKHSCNRELNQENLNKIKNSILFKNMLNLRPIVLNKSMEVIDGQHRLEVAKQLNLDVYYIIQEEYHDTDIILLNNNQRAWVVSDYLNFYCNQGNEEYIRLKNFIEKNNIKDVTNALIIIGQYGSYYVNSFKSGMLKLPKSLSDFQNKWICIKSIQDRLDCIMTGNSRYFYKGARFMRALIVVSSIEGFDFSLFLKRIESRLDAIHQCDSVKKYVDMLKGIYNYRNPNPIE